MVRKGVERGESGVNGGTIRTIEVITEWGLVENGKGGVIWGFQAEGLVAFEFFVFFPIFGLQNVSLH